MTPTPDGGVRTHTVRVEPIGVDLEVRSDETVMAAALRVGLTWPTLCNGKAECAVCALKIVEGLPEAVERGEREQDALRRFKGITGQQKPDVRLACQLQACGALVVRKPGVRQPGAV